MWISGRVYLVIKILISHACQISNTQGTININNISINENGEVKSIDNRNDVGNG